MEFDQISGHPVPVKMTHKWTMLPSRTLTKYMKEVTRKEVYLTYIPCNKYGKSEKIALNCSEILINDLRSCIWMAINFNDWMAHDFNFH